MLRLSCLRKFNIWKLKGLRNSSKNLICKYSVVVVVVVSCCFFVVCYIMSSFASTLCWVEYMVDFLGNGFLGGSCFVGFCFTSKNKIWIVSILLVQFFYLMDAVVFHENFAFVSVIFQENFTFVFVLRDLSIQPWWLIDEFFLFNRRDPTCEILNKT